MRTAFSNKTIIFFLATALLFSAFYNPKLASTQLPLMVYILLLAGLYTFLKNIRTLKFIILNKNSVAIFFWLLLLIVYSLFVSTFVGGGKDYSIPYNYTIWFIAFIAPTLVAAVLFANSSSYYLAYKAVAVISFLQAILIILSALFPSFRDFLGSLLAGNSQGYIGGWTFRVVGFSGSGGATLGLIQAFGASVCILLFVQLRQKVWVFCSLIIFASILPIARTGTIFFCIFLMLFLPNISLRKFVLKGFLIYLISGMCVILFSIYMVPHFPRFQALFDFVSSWGLTPYRFIFDITNEPTIKILSQHWVFPVDFSNYLFGSGLHIIDGKNLVGDPGYIRYFYYFGSMGVIIHYSFFLFLMLFTIKCTRNFNVRRFIIIIYVIFFIFELKEPFSMKSNVLLIFMFFHSIVYKYKSDLWYRQMLISSNPT